VIATGFAAARDGRWVARDGRVIDVAWSCTPLPMIESGPLYLISATDITDRKRHEEEVRESRARIVAAADEARRRLERNLHDGAQQRLVTLTLTETRHDERVEAAAYYIISEASRTWRSTPRPRRRRSARRPATAASS